LEDKQLNSSGNKAWINTSSKLECVKKMPELKHSVKGEPFDIKNSEVVKWLLEQPEVLSYLVEPVNGHDKRRERLIIYNPERGTWKGIANES